MFDNTVYTILPNIQCIDVVLLNTFSLKTHLAIKMLQAFNCRFKISAISQLNSNFSYSLLTNFLLFIFGEKTTFI